jgi:hypothetical protein
MVILIVTGSFGMNLSAQEALKAVMKKCENADSVDVKVVSQKKFGETKEKKETTVMIDISFKNNEGLKKEILDAFEKDRDQAKETAENKRNGKIYGLHYRFEKSYYSYSEDMDGKVSFVFREDFQSKK